MNTAQNYAGKGNSANPTSPTVENDPQPATEPNYRQVEVRTPRQRHYDVLHQTLDTLTSERQGSHYVEILGDLLDGWLRDTTRITEEGEEPVYELSAFHLDRIWATTRLMANLVKIDETWSAIQRTKTNSVR